MFCHKAYSTETLAESVLVLLQKLMSWAGAQKGDVNVTVEETLSGLRKQMEY